MKKVVNVRSSSGTLSLQLELKPWLMMMLLFCSMIVLMTIGLALGSTWVSPITIFQYVIGMDVGSATFIIESLRLPRMLVALFAGAALGVSGLILQEMVRNPLASPDIIGITGGGTLAAVFFITTLGGIVSLSWLPLAAMGGSAVVSLFIYMLAWKDGISPIRLILIGIGINALLSALTTLMIVFSPLNTSSQAYVWMTGSVYGASWTDVGQMFPWVIVCIPLALLLTRAMHVHQLGEEVATSLGARMQVQRFMMISISVLLAGVAVAFAGGISFVGLMAPHIARLLFGKSFAVLVPAAALIGGMMVFSADVIGRTAFLPLDVPVGVFVSAIGAPFFLYLLYRNRHQ
ncbi:iron ABC transporter permease [Geomicrobium sp. JCM 19039]|uniref:FecCD family ABC transporter permease n=2 Tax=unclassified Geomicrobium TaxID=2628951 RepID=UPI00045F1FAC|nr:iron ABC transporter permease [Geomicrobium sp. JCM 19039]GAK14087.1 ABC-type Fe3+-siderophore transport system, permease 2 component [Geomicrobium sp. JCM 19039]